MRTGIKGERLYKATTRFATHHYNSLYTWPARSTGASSRRVDGATVSHSRQQALLPAVAPRLARKRLPEGLVEKGEQIAGHAHVVGRRRLRRQHRRHRGHAPRPGVGLASRPRVRCRCRCRCRRGLDARGAGGAGGRATLGGLVDVAHPAVAASPAAEAVVVDGDAVGTRGAGGVEAVGGLVEDGDEVEGVAHGGVRHVPARDVEGGEAGEGDDGGDELAEGEEGEGQVGVGGDGEPEGHELFGGGEAGVEVGEMAGAGAGGAGPVGVLEGEHGELLDAEGGVEVEEAEDGVGLVQAWVRLSESLEVGCEGFDVAVAVESALAPARIVFVLVTTKFVVSKAHLTDVACSRSSHT